MRKGVIVFLFFFNFIILPGQQVKNNVSGQVSFVSTQNIYVKFRSTAGISVGDTLFVEKGGKLIPSLLVKNQSSSSCVCAPILQTSLSVADPVIARVRPVTKETSGYTPVPVAAVVPVSEVVKDSTINKSEESAFKQNLRGSISVNSYSDLSNSIADNSQRFRYTLSLNAGNIADSKYSFETYVSFKHKAGEWQQVQDNVFNALKIYSLSLRYDLNKSTHLSLGRRINPKISSIGAVDGLQFEKAFNRFSFGALAGFRPDYITYGFDFSLFQYGAFAAYNTKSSYGFSETSLAFMQQMNNSKTDRRFLYFQHSNTLVKNLNLFTTLEADLYELTTDSFGNELPASTFNLTGLYLSLSYRPGRNLSLSGSYDARKNVIYYETYKTYVDRILENELRQGFRLQASYRITRDITFGIQSGYRYLKSDPHVSKNLYGYLTYSQIPALNITATLSGTLLESAFMTGNIYSLNLSRDFFKGKLQASTGYRYIDYYLPENYLNLIQNIGEASLSWQVFNKLSFSVSYEGTFESQDHFNRIYIQLRKRF
jgi:hypothetical protein